MPNICLFFQVHQPRRLNRYTVFDIGQNREYENDDLNRDILGKVAAKCYLPANALLFDLIKEYRGDFRVSFSLTGTLIEQLEAWYPEVLESFQKLGKTGCVEWLNETYAHSLASLYAPGEFQEQVRLHRDKISALFGKEAVSFRNTEMIYNNDIAHLVGAMGYQVMLTEGADHLLQHGGNPFISCRSAPHPDLTILLRHYRLSDDIAFRFSAKEWFEYPLTATKYARWLGEHAETSEVINLFMDYETFGEHQWEETGIFDFLKELPKELMKYNNFYFVTPAQIIPDPSSPLLDIDKPISWADLERDITAWTGNGMQRDAIHSVYQLEEKVKKSGDENALKTWRRLQTSDHFYYMCTKWFSDGDVHAYFNPWESPYDAYISYMNILDDFGRKL